MGSNLTIPAGTQIIDLGGATLLRGLIDCHTHLTFQHRGDSELKVMDADGSHVRKLTFNGSGERQGAWSPVP